MIRLPRGIDAIITDIFDKLIEYDIVTEKRRVKYIVKLFEHSNQHYLLPFLNKLGFEETSYHNNRQCAINNFQFSFSNLINNEEITDLVDMSYIFAR